MTSEEPVRIDPGVWTVSGLPGIVAMGNQVQLAVVVLSTYETLHDHKTVNSLSIEAS